MPGRLSDVPMLNIVIPMAGAGTRFVKAGYAVIKPLISIHGTPMIKLVIDNLRPSCAHRFIFVCQRAHNAAYGLKARLGAWAPGSVLVEIDGMTAGAACTVLAAKSFIDTDDPLMVANSDQFIESDVDDYLKCMDIQALDGLIMTMKSRDPKWSFALVDERGLVGRVAEKEVISDEATVGVYGFRAGKLFVSAAERMIRRDLRVNGEFYVAPTYNQMIEDGHRIGISNVGVEGAGMHGLGTPVDLKAFESLELSRRARDDQT